MTERQQQGWQVMRVPDLLLEQQQQVMMSLHALLEQWHTHHEQGNL